MKLILSFLQNQYHACWCAGDFRSQCISRHGIDTPKPEYSVSSIRRVNIPFAIWGDWPWPSRSNLPHVELVRTITHHPFKLGSPNLDQRCKIPWLNVLGEIDLDLQGQIYLKITKFHYAQFHHHTTLAVKKIHVHHSHDYLDCFKVLNTCIS